MGGPMNWQDKFKASIDGMDISQLIEVIDDCYSKANALSRYGFTANHDTERTIWKQKAQIAINKRRELIRKKWGIK